MKKSIQSVFTVCLVAILFSSCSKTIDKTSQPLPPNQEKASYVQFSVNGVPLNDDKLFALMSIETTGGQPVVNNKKVSLNYVQGLYKTDSVELAKGTYKVTKFLVTKNSDTALYAVPKVNTPKATEVSTPLSFPLEIKEQSVNNNTLQALKIKESDSPEIYGYTSDEFGYLSFINLKLKLKISVGSVIYDNLPGKVSIDATNATGMHWLKELDLKKGINTVSVPASYMNYKFEVSKWNVVAEKKFNRVDLPNDVVVELSAMRNPKRLIEMSTFIENSGGSTPESRTTYSYNVQNRLNEINYYQKSTVINGLPLTIIYKFTYKANVTDTIFTYSGDNKLTGFTAFFYKGGKIANISKREYDQQTGAAVAYSQDADRNYIDADYLLSNGNTMTYKISISNGNKVSDVAHSSTGFESGNYEYDDNINPFHQLGYPDLFFTNSSKNNLVKENKSYQGGFPTAIPNKIEYKYDDDGYPVEVLTQYKGYTSGVILYSIKKIYRYQ